MSSVKPAAIQRVQYGLFILLWFGVFFSICILVFFSFYYKNFENRGFSSRRGLRRPEVRPTEATESPPCSGEYLYYFFSCFFFHA